MSIPSINSLVLLVRRRRCVLDTGDRTLTIDRPEFCPVRPAANQSRIDRKTIRAFDYGEVARLFFRRRVGRKPTGRSRLLATTDTAYVVTAMSRPAPLYAILFMKKNPQTRSKRHADQAYAAVRSSIVDRLRRAEKNGTIAQAALL